MLLEPERTANAHPRFALRPVNIDRISQDAEITTRLRMGWRADESSSLFQREDSMKVIVGVSAILFFAAISPAAAVTYCDVTASVLMLRSGPGVKYRVIDRLKRRTTVRKIDASGNWARVHRVRGNERVGWASKTYLRCRYAE